ncbi:16921_t:CDS:2 [Funneliformis geosporum]|uniref:6967_t:CDS:1 n=1 Tax=Funneliformis geosporum TaxID=1117311 RepID=A0A9W4SBJ7_9GLOM|nr:6967_t:CDS:2 [Funneliformis geosporum]CAI2164138.1 16921_t:CDS:2 [Funneliformis geosporum]
MSSTTHTDDDVYHEKELILNTLKTSLGFAGVGLLIAAAQNSYYDYTRASTVFTKYGSTVTGFALLGGIFTATETISANVRKTDDWINGAVAGCAAGLTTGIRARSHALSIGACLGIGGLMGFYEFSGAWKGLLKDKTEEEKRNWRYSIFKDNKPELDEE